MVSQSTFNQLNHFLKVSVEPSSDSLSKALQIARTQGAFKQSNVVFVYNQLYAINPQNPSQSLQQLKMLKQQKAE